MMIGILNKANSKTVTPHPSLPMQSLTPDAPSLTSNVRTYKVVGQTMLSIHSFKYFSVHAPQFIKQITKK